MKITKTTNGSYKAVLPKLLVESLGWGKGTNLKTTIKGKKMILELKEN